MSKKENITYAERQLKRVRYPHMVREEIEIWKEFLRKYGGRFDKYRYDVHVGKGAGRIPGLSEPYKTMAITISQKRIDVVAYRGKKAYIIELKDSADLQAIGQLEGYKTLYEDRHGKGLVEGLIIVSYEADQDIMRAAKERNIRIMLV